MSVTYHGTITKDKGLLPAAGTVVITTDGGTPGPSTQTLDATGSFSVALANGGLRVTAVYTITGDPYFTTRTKVLTAVDGASVDLGLDIGRVGAPLAEATNVVATAAAHQSAVSAPAAVTSAQASALTSSQNATTGAATQTSSYVQADVQTIATLANALKVSYNALQVDVAAILAAYQLAQADVVALRAEVAALTTSHNALNTALQTASLES